MARPLLKSPSLSKPPDCTGALHRGLFAIGVLVCVLFVAGCREFVPYAPPTSVSGYAVQGRVVIPDGIPVYGDSVVVDFNYDLLSLTRMDSTYIFVGDPPLTLLVKAFTPAGKVVRTIYAARPEPGYIYRKLWDEKDDSGKFVAPGLYYIKYIYNNDTLKSVPYLVDNRLAALTDVNGDFYLGPQNLPVGTAFDVYLYDDTTYIGTYAVDPAVDLVFTSAHLQDVYETDLSPNQIFQALFVLQ